VVSGTQLPTNRLPVRTFNPVLSADGRHLAFRISTGLTRDDVNGIWWFDLAGGTNAQIPTGAADGLQLSFDDASGPVMSADGRTLAFEVRTELPSPVIRLWQPESGIRSIESFQATVPPGGGEPVASEAPVLSADGTQLAFLTTSAVPGTEIVTDGDYRLVVRTLATGRTFVAPVGPDDFAYDLAFPEFSADGRQLLFQSEMILGRQADENQTFDVFLADLGTGALASVSVAADAALPATPDGLSSTPGHCISHDGRFVVFASFAPDVLAGDTNGVRDVFRHDRKTGETRLVSRGLGGTFANATSTPLQISPGGHLVLFSSLANNLATGDTNGLEDVFLADLEAGTVVLVSAKDGEDASSTSRGSNQALMSADGQRVFFLSTARDLVSGPPAGSTGNNLLLREPAQKRTRLLSRDTAGGLTGIQGRVIQFGLIEDGARAYFTSGFSTAADLYEFDLATSLLRRLTTDRMLSFAVAPAGNRLAYISLPAGVPRRLILRELPSGAESAPLDFATTAPVDPLRFSRDGSSLVFVTAEALPTSRTGIEDTNSASDVFHLDVGANVLRLISVGDHGQLGNGAANQPQISRDGRRIVFRSTASNLVVGDANGLADAFLHDVATGRSTLLSANPVTGRPANFLSTTPGLSDDGRFATFVSGASDLVANDFNGDTDVFGVVLPAVTAGDTDLDGMDDDWERTHFGSLAPTAEADADGDGRSNRDEYLAGTNPTEATSVFRVGVGQLGANELTLTWTSQPGVGYVVETAAALTPSSFQPAGPAITGDGTVKSATVAVTGETGFLRVRAQR
jgi:Tol biopolymer transport system component